MQSIKKLRWQCRRGKLELDWFLSRYLDSCYGSADLKEQNTFHQLLELEDVELLPYFMGDKQPEQKTIADLVNKIRSLSEQNNC